MTQSCGRRRRRLDRRPSALCTPGGARVRFWRRCLCGTILAWGLSSTAATSADPGSTPAAETESTHSAPALRREAALQPTVPPPWPADSPPSFPSPAQESERDALEDLQQAKERQFQRLQQQILELGRRWNGRREGTTSAPNDRGAAAPPAAGGAEPATTPEVAPAGDAPLPPLPSTPSDSPSAHLPLDGPVDRLGLADSLFATGQIEAAARVYAELEQASLTPDERAWIQFQRAACDRRSGRISAAQQRYRDLITAGQPEWLMPLARWWLKAIDDRERLSANADKLKTILQQLETEVTRELQPDSGATVGADPESRR